MAKRHQASRRKAYGRRQHELRERFDRTGLFDDHTADASGFASRTWQATPDAFGGFDLAVAGGLRYASRD